MLHLLRQKRKAIIQGWIQAVLRTFPPDSARFLETTGNPFGNPIGATISTEIEALFDAITRDAPSEELAPHLDRIVQVTCVQDVEPSRSVAFVFELEKVVRKALVSELGDRRGLEKLLDFGARIDELAMQAFDSYARYRQRISDIRVREAQGRVSTLLKMAGMNWDDVPSGEQSPGGCGR